MPISAASTPPGSGWRRCGGEGEGRASPGEFTRVGADGAGTHGATYGVHTSSSGVWVPALRGFAAPVGMRENKDLPHPLIPAGPRRSAGGRAGTQRANGRQAIEIACLDRKRVVEGKSGAVSVELGGPR